MKIIHAIEETTCTSTWLKACELLAEQEDKTLYTLILGVHQPAVVTSAEFRMHDVLNEFLLSKDQLPLSSIANTLFPAGLYLQGGPDAVFREFPALYPKMREGWGTYAYRMLNPTIARDGVNLSALEILVEKLKKQKKRGRMRAAYELDLLNEPEDADIALYQPSLDCGRTIGQPCLTHLSFKLHPDDRLSLTALYRSHFYMQKTLGNLLGLSQLMCFVAEQVRLEVGPLVCHSTLAQLEYGGTNDWSLKEALSVLQDCRRALAPEPSVV
jgi:hypothetical protein